MNNSLIRLLVAYCLTTVSFCALAQTKSGRQEVLSVDELVNKLPVNDSTLNIDQSKIEALRDAALSYGMQAGLAAEYAKTMKRLEASALYMDKTYPFQALMMEGNVVPPVIEEINNVFDQQDSDHIRIADRERRISAPPRFAYTTPSWRDYYQHDFRFDSDATPLVIPKTSEEKEFWKKTVREGYEAGVNQAHKIFDMDTAMLSRDINGMRLYHQLLQAGKVTKPYVAVVHSGVTGNKKGLLKEGESHLQISATPEFVMDSNQWKIPLPTSIQERIRLLADPVLGGKLVESLGSSKDTESLKQRGGSR